MKVSLEKLLKILSTAREALSYAKLIGSDLAIHSASIRYQGLYNCLMEELNKPGINLVPVAWPNNCHKVIPTALRYLSENLIPAGGSQCYNSEHLYMMADELENISGISLFYQERISLWDENGGPLEVSLFKPVHWVNDCDKFTISALRYLAEYVGDLEGRIYTGEQLKQLADEIDLMGTPTLFTYEAKVVN